MIINSYLFSHRLESFGHFGLNSLDRDLKLGGNLIIFNTFKPVQTEDGTTTLRQFINSGINERLKLIDLHLFLRVNLMGIRLISILCSFSKCLLHILMTEIL